MNIFEDATWRKDRRSEQPVESTDPKKPWVRVKPQERVPLPLLIQRSFFLYERQLQAMKSAMDDLIDLGGPIVYYDMARDDRQELTPQLCQRYNIKIEELDRMADSNIFSSHFPEKGCWVEAVGEKWYVIAERRREVSMPAEDVVDNIFMPYEQRGTRISGKTVDDILLKAKQYNIEMQIITVLRMVVPFVFYTENEGHRTASEHPY